MHLNPTNCTPRAGTTAAATSEHPPLQHVAGAGGNTSPSQQHQRRAGDSEEGVQELTMLVLRQQVRLGELQQQVAELQAAVCKLDASAPVCKRRA